MRKLNVLKEGMKVIIVLVMVAMMAGAYIAVDQRITRVEQQVEETQEMDREVLDHLKEIKTQTDEINRLTQERIKQEQEREEREQQHVKAIKTAKNTGLSVHSDLVTSTVALNTEDMNRIIDSYTAHVKNSNLRGHGGAFIEASRETGLNPIYILAHAIIESGSGTSYLARNRYNFFGIAAYDSNPGAAYAMGGNVDEGIINGAKWIKHNFYDEGYTTLSAMKKGGYASSDRWASDIAQVANSCIKLL